MFYKKTVLAHGPRRSIVGGSAVTTGAAAAGQLPLSHVVQHGIRGGRSERYRQTRGGVPSVVGHSTRARWGFGGAPGR